MRAKPVVLPPPKFVRKPKQKTTSEVVLYIFASLSLTSVFGTVGRPGCRISTTWKPIIIGFSMQVMPLFISQINNKKSKLMLMRRARAYSSSGSQVILVYRHPLHRNSPFCSQISPKKSLKIPIYRVQCQSKSSMLSVDNPKKRVASACYVKQHVCAYLQPFSH